MKAALHAKQTARDLRHMAKSPCDFMQAISDQHELGFNAKGFTAWNVLELCLVIDWLLNSMGEGMNAYTLVSSKLPNDCQDVDFVDRNGHEYSGVYFAGENIFCKHNDDSVAEDADLPPVDNVIAWKG